MVLPIDRRSRGIVPQLQAAGCDVTYREFGGPQTVPRERAQEAASWLAASAAWSFAARYR